MALGSVAFDVSQLGVEAKDTSLPAVAADWSWGRGQRQVVTSVFALLNQGQSGSWASSNRSLQPSPGLTLWTGSHGS